MKSFNRSLAIAAIFSGLGLAACQQKPAETAAPAVEQSAMPATADQAAAPAAVYTCSMHPEVQQAAPGKCPQCNMDLVQKS